MIFLLMISQLLSPAEQYWVPNSCFCTFKGASCTLQVQILMTLTPPPNSPPGPGFVTWEHPLDHGLLTRGRVWHLERERRRERERGAPGKKDAAAFAELSAATAAFLATDDKDRGKDGGGKEGGDVGGAGGLSPEAAAEAAEAAASELEQGMSEEELTVRSHATHRLHPQCSRLAPTRAEVRRSTPSRKHASFMMPNPHC